MKNEKKEMRYWKNWNNLKNEIDKFLEENSNYNSLPCYNELIKLGYSSMGSSIQKYYGGFHKVRKKLGRMPIKEKISKNMWKDLKFILSEAREIMKKHGFNNIPSDKILRDLGYSSICNSIQRYHGGVNKIRELLSLDSRRKKSQTWESLEYVLEYVKKFLEKNNLDELPSAGKLREMKEHGIVNSCARYFGGLNVFRDKFREYLGQPNQENQLESFLENYLGGSNE